MSFIHIPYDSVSHLLSGVRSINPIAHSALPNDKERPPNFVLIEPELYYGTFGGLVYDSVLKFWNTDRFISSSIGDGLSVVWWKTTNPEAFGDLQALSTNDGKYVIVTPDIFQKLVLNKLRTKRKVKSSYFGPFVFEQS